MKLFYKCCFTVLTLMVMIACGNNQKANDNNPIELLIDSATNEGFTGDVHLSVIKTQIVDTAITYTLQALYKNKPVGLEASVPKNTIRRKDGFGEGVVIKSTGKNSDAFINALAEIYKLKATGNRKFVNEITVTYVDLAQFIKGLGEKKVNDEENYFKRLKLFFGPTEEGEAEVFLNIDKEQKIVEFLEKDPEYRSLLVDFLTQK